MSPDDDRHACPRCGATGPCSARHCPTYHECAECGKTWVRYVFAQLEGAH